jgi:hypothetical protein
MHHYAEGEISARSPHGKVKQAVATRFYSEGSTNTRGDNGVNSPSKNSHTGETIRAEQEQRFSTISQRLGAWGL